MLTVGNEQGKITFFELDTGNVIRTRQAHGGRMDQLLLSEDGTVLYSSGGDNTIRIWRLS